MGHARREAYRADAGAEYYRQMRVARQWQVYLRRQNKSSIYKVTRAFQHR